MKSFYSLIKISPNEMSGDSLTIGLILSSLNGYKVRFSKNRKQLAKTILSTDGSIVDFIEREISNNVKRHNKIISNCTQGFFELETLLNSEYFVYLSKYSNGLLKITAPSFIADDIDEIKFNKLFNLFVDNKIYNEENRVEVKNKEAIFNEKVKTNLINRVQNKVHVHQNIDNKIVPSLFNPFQIDCIGLNGAFVGAKSLPFTQSKETLHKSINTYISVIAQLSSQFNKPLDDNKFFLIADQPMKKTPEYDLWQLLYRNERLLKIISSEESGQVAELIESSHATTFLPE